MRRAHYGGPAHFSFGPGLMTPAVKALIWVNVGVFVAGAANGPETIDDSIAQGQAAAMAALATVKQNQRGAA